MNILQQSGAEIKLSHESLRKLVEHGMNSKIMLGEIEIAKLQLHPNSGTFYAATITLEPKIVHVGRAERSRQKKSA